MVQERPPRRADAHQGNGTLQRITGEVGRGSFNNTFFPKTGSWGISLSRPKYSVKFNWNYRSRIRQAAISGRGIEPGTYDYDGERLYLDIHCKYYFTAGSASSPASGT